MNASFGACIFNEAFQKGFVNQKHLFLSKRSQKMRIMLYILKGFTFGVAGCLKHPSGVINLTKIQRKNSDPPIINPIIREKKVLILAANFQSQIGPQSTLVGVHAHTCVLGCRWYDKPDKNLEKNSDLPIINPIIREKKVLFSP